MKTPEWLQHFCRDFTTKKFVPLKMIYFLSHAAIATMLPFLTLHARSLGVLEAELGVMAAVTSVFIIVTPTLAGMLADKLGNFKVFLSLTLAASGGVSLLFSAVPAARRHHPLPDALPLTLARLDDGPPTLTLALAPPLHCDVLPDLHNLTVTLANCSLCDPTSTGGGGCVLPRSATCSGRRVAAPCQAEVQVRVVQPAANASSVPFLEVVHWSGTAAVPQRNAGVDRGCCSCSATVARGDLCTNPHVLQTYDTTKTFWLYLLVLVVTGATVATGNSLFDGATVVLLKEFGGDYGYQRLYGNLGIVIMTPLSGLFIDLFSDRLGVQDFRPAFYMHCVFKVAAAGVVLFMDLEFRQPSSRVLKDLRGLVRKPEILVFLSVIFISGSCFGLLAVFLFWLLDDLGAKKYLMGITTTVGSVAGIPFLVASGFIFRKLGLANTIALGLAVYVVRLTGYSFITNPWWCMPFEALECFTTSLLTAASTMYAGELATPSTLATLQCIVCSLYNGVGRGVGSLLSGLLIGPLGLRNVFRVFALLSGVTAIIYFTVNCVFFRKLQKERSRKALQDVPTEGQNAAASIRSPKDNMSRESYEEDHML